MPFYQQRAHAELSGSFIDGANPISRDAVYKGGLYLPGSGTPGADAYRVFVQGTTGFVSIQSVRDDAEQRAKEFCARKHQTMESLAETTAKPPHILGNFPRVEIVFDCVAVPDAQPAFAGEHAPVDYQTSHLTGREP